MRIRANRIPYLSQSLILSLSTHKLISFLIQSILYPPHIRFKNLSERLFK